MRRNQCGLPRSSFDCCRRRQTVATDKLLWPGFRGSKRRLVRGSARGVRERSWALSGPGQLPSLPLRWHYRSHHESLITYSNRQFYESRLITFPGAIASGPDVGVEHFYVADGIYGRGHSKDNVLEARAVVARILEHARSDRTSVRESVAFSEPQATRIAMELEAARRERPDLDSFFTADRLDGFFVKNLENVQGDEKTRRDHLQRGLRTRRTWKVRNEFRPLNREGGFRRLNVAVTRAGTESNSSVQSSPPTSSTGPTMGSSVFGATWTTPPEGLKH